MPRKVRTKLTDQMKKKIVDNLCKGISIAATCRQNPGFPTHRSIIEHANPVVDPEFADDVSQAYTVYYMMRIDELDHLTSKSALELYPHIQDWKQAEATRKARIDVIKFDLAKCAAIFSRRFDRAQKVEVEANVTGTTTQQLIYTVNYADLPNVIEGQLVKSIGTNNSLLPEADSI